MSELTELAERNFFRDPEVTADPYPYLEAIRGKCPVHREPNHDVVMVTGYDEAVEVFQDSGTFSSCASVVGPFAQFPVPLEGDDVSALIEEHRDSLPLSDQIITFDPPVHTAHRALLMKLITPKRLKENEAVMWQLADQLLDGYLAPGAGEFIAGFAAPYTLLVIADLLGVPDDDRDRVARGLQHGGAVGGTGDHAMAHNPLEFLYETFTAYIEEKRRKPSHDVLTGMASATFPDGSTPSAEEVARVACNVFSAGQETTVRLLSTALKVLAEDQELQQLLRRERDRIPNFVEEVLRIDGPIKGDFRLARVPTTVGGVDIPAGTTVMLLNGAANRDPRHFEDPDKFDAGRQNARHHIAFGRGVHTCPGSPLARAEARASLERILDRTEEIRISEQHHGPADARRYDYVPTFILRGLTELHLEFVPAAGRAQ
jgi:cytochrome P450